MLNFIKILMKSEKDQRNILPIPWVFGLIFPLVRFYGFEISDNNSEVNNSWQIYFLLTQKEILKSGHL